MTRAIDLVVAERVFRVEPCGSWSRFHSGGPRGPLYAKRNPCAHEPGRCVAEPLFPPAYSSTWEGLGAVVEAMRAKGWEPSLCVDGPAWEAMFETPDYDAERGTGRREIVEDASAPLAVALAALRALGVPAPEGSAT